MRPLVFAKDKIKNRQDLVNIRDEARRAGKKVVFTNGCFDILHIGHIRYIEEAALKGDFLIVGINSDLSVSRLKGEGRPVNKATERAELIASFYCVDYVTIFEEETPNELLSQLQPDVHVKGGDYRKEDLPEAAVVNRYGGEVVVVGFIPDRSTSSILNKVKGL